MADEEGRARDFGSALAALRSNEESRIPVINGLRTLDLCHSNESSLTVDQANDFAAALGDNVHVEALTLAAVTHRSDSVSSLITRFLETILPTHRYIKFLAIANCDFTNSHAQLIRNALKTNTVLTKIYLTYIGDDISITAGGKKNLIEGLKQCNTLQDVFLMGFKINIEAASIMASWIADERCILKKLCLIRCNLGDVEAEVLAEGLSENKSLLHLVLAVNIITDSGCQSIATKALRNNCSLCELALDLNVGITDAGVSALVENMRHLNYTLEGVSVACHLNTHRGLSDAERELYANLQQRITELCQANIRLKAHFREFNNRVATIPLSLWPRNLEVVSSKPDLIYAMLKSKPDICRRQQPRNVRRRRRSSTTSAPRQQDGEQQPRRRSRRRRRGPQRLGFESLLLMMIVLASTSINHASSFITPEGSQQPPQQLLPSPLSFIRRRIETTRTQAASINTTKSIAPEPSSSTCRSWREVSIDSNSNKQNLGEESADASSSSSSSTTTIGERVKCGESVVLLDGGSIATPGECQTLIEWSFLHRQKEKSNNGSSNSIDKPGLTRLPTIDAWERARLKEIPCTKNPLPEKADALCRLLLKRVLKIIDEELPSITSTLFGDDSNGEEQESLASSLSDMFDRDLLDYSSREPAINVYTEGGEFLAHKDAQALTVLIPLSIPGVDFTGGGTAFWSQDSRGHRVEEPSTIVKPTSPATALLFGGCVTRAGLPVADGERVVFVASFSSRRNRASSGVDTEEQQRDIYGDSL